MIIDASQSAGVLSLDMDALGTAFIAMPGHKGLYGPQGTGVLLCGREVKKVSHKDSSFFVTDGEETVRCDKLIVACGGIAGSKLGGTMSGYQILRSMGHHCTKLRPSLVQLKSKVSVPTVMCRSVTMTGCLPNARVNCSLRSTACPAL